MNLKDTYKEVSLRLSKVNFPSLWPNFKKLKYSLYDEFLIVNEEEVIERNKVDDDIYQGNTVFFNNGEYEVIWEVLDDEPDCDVIASKIVRLMFNGFQMQNYESRYPQELECLVGYEYNPENITIRCKENEIIKKMINDFDMDDFNQLLKYRQHRKKIFTFDYNYEGAVEQVEGTALFVELYSLWMININKYRKYLETLTETLIDINKCCEIRLQSSIAGALLIKIMNENDINYNKHFNNEYYFDPVLNFIYTSDVNIDPDPNISDIIRKHNNETNDIINKTVRNQNNMVINKDYKITNINYDSARYYNGYLVTYYFLGYSNYEGDNVLYGNYVIKLSPDNHIDKAYKIQ